MRLVAASMAVQRSVPGQTTTCDKEISQEHSNDFDTWVSRYLDLPQFSPFGFVCTERTDAVDLWCLRHCEGAGGAGGCC